MKTASLLMMVILTCLLLGSAVLASDYGHAGKNRSAKLYGRIEVLPENNFEGRWIISGQPVNVYKKTQIKEEHGRATTGRYVEVKGEWVGDVFIAFAIEVEENDNLDPGTAHAKFYGTVESMPQKGYVGIWRINGRELHVKESTRIKEKYGTAFVGSYVEVEGNFSGETFVVYKIEVKDRGRHGLSRY